MRKMIVNVNIKLFINADEGVSLSEIMDELDYDFTYADNNADIEDSYIDTYELIDSK